MPLLANGVAPKVLPVGHWLVRPSDNTSTVRELVAAAGRCTRRVSFVHRFTQGSTRRTGREALIPHHLKTAVGSASDAQHPTIRQGIHRARLPRRAAAAKISERGSPARLAKPANIGRTAKRERPTRGSCRPSNQPASPRLPTRWSPAPQPNARTGHCAIEKQNAAVDPICWPAVRRKGASSGS